MFINEPSWPNVRIVKSILETYQRTGNIHHAYLIEGEPRRLLPKVLEIVEEISGESSSANPDVYLVRVPKFLIDEARDIREKAWRRPFGRGPKFFVISAQSLTVEAAQALLKIFEDPPSRTHFFLLVPSLSVVMPTLRSRFFVISSANQFPFGSRKSLPLAKEFLGSSPAERFKIGEEFEKGDEEIENEIGAEKLRSFLAELEISLVGEPERLKYLNDLSLARKYLTDRGANVRLIFEHLAIVLPRL